MKKWHLLSFLLTSLMFSGCSIQQYFILANSTDDPIVIKYSLDDPTNGKSIFGTKGEVYQSNREYFPNWEHQLPYQDLNNSDEHVQIKLGPKSTLVFATLSNDKYDIATMRSANGKEFNLEQMTFSVNGTDYAIDKNNFHDFFIENSGTFQYIIQ